MATLYEKMKLMKGLLTGDTAYIGPFYVTVDVTRRCNFRCPGCRYHSPMLNTTSPGDRSILDIPFSLAEKLFEEFKEMGTSGLILIGEGEPFLHPRLFDIILAAKDAGLHITLLTNGTLLNKTNVHSIIGSGLDILKVSLWASSAEEYEKNYPGTTSANFENIIKGLRILAHIKVKQKSTLPTVVLHHPISRHNFKKIDTMVDLVDTTGCHTLSFSPFKSRRGKLASAALSLDEEKFLCLSLDRMKKRLDSLPINHNIDQTLLRYEIGEEVRETLPCYIGWLHARIKVDGTVFSCNPCDLPMGNLNENRFQEIWNTSTYRHFRRKTLTRKGLASMSKHCDCGYCCHVEDNLRVHRLFRWFAPLKSLFNVHH